MRITYLISIVYFLFCYSATIAYAQNTENQQQLTTLIETGKRIYQLGILPDGKPLRGISAGGVELTGSQVSCIRCHRRSGFGSNEANLRISPILGEILYKERNKSYQQWQQKRTKGHGARPAYTDATLKNALTKGTGADNRTLDKLMPRFKLKDSEATAVIDYLKSLTLKPDPGITDNTIHIATIVTSDVAKKSSQAMLDLLNIFIKDVNAKTRKEQRRASNSPWHKKWEYEAYRTIKLHIWELVGKPASWNAQLQTYYNKNNVFAIIGGISDSPWTTIHQFCEQIELPCLFPTTELPEIKKKNIYNFYYSAGIAYDAKSIAEHISNIANSKNKTILQLYRNSEINNIAVNVLKNYLTEKSINSTSHKITTTENLSTQQLANIVKKYNPTIIVAWLNANDAAVLNSKILNAKSIERLYYSYSHLGEQYKNSIKNHKNKSYLVYRYMLPERKKLHITRATVWAKRKKIDITNEKIIGNAFFAITLFNRAVKKMRAYLKRDYLLEIIESMLENNAFQSVYPDLSLGPDQRIASKGAYILGPLDKKDINKKENHVWIRH